jgi:hypothetical protein
MLGNSWVAEQLAASQEWPSSIELVSSLDYLQFHNTLLKVITNVVLDSFVSIGSFTRAPIAAISSHVWGTPSFAVKVILTSALGPVIAVCPSRQWSYDFRSLTNVSMKKHDSVSLHSGATRDSGAACQLVMHRRHVTTWRGRHGNSVTAGHAKWVPHTR